MKNKARIIKCIFISIVIWAFLCSNPSYIFPNIYAQKDAGVIVNLITVFQRIQAIFSDFSLLKEVAFVAIAVVVYKCRISRKCGMIRVVLNLILTTLYLLSESFYYTDSTAYLFGDVFTFIFAIVRGSGLFICLMFVTGLIFDFFDKSRGGKYTENKWGFFKIFSILGIFWLPCLIALFPGGYLLDTQIQLRQFFGYEVLSDAHPPFNTFVVGFFVKLGNLLHNPTIGLFLCTLVQFIFILSIISYAVSFVVKRVKSDIFGYISVVFCGLMSFFYVYAATVGKDATYSCCLLMLSLAAFCIFEEIKSSNPDRKRVCLNAVSFAAFSLLGSLMRHNGIYIALPMVALVVLLLIVKKKEIRLSALAGAIMLAGSLSYFVISKAVFPAIGVEKSSDSLIYVNMLQHTARIALEYPEEITPEDIEIINRVSDFDSFEDVYKTTTSDGIKSVSRLDAAPEDVAAYKALWFRQIKKHPFVIFESSYNMTYGFFAPVAENTVNDFGEWFYESQWPEFDFRIPFFVTGIRHLYESVLSVLVKLPVLRLLHNPGLYSWVMFICVAYLIEQKKMERLVVLLPMIISFLFYFVTPSYYGHSRYCFPLVYEVFLAIGLCIISGNGNEGEDKDGSECAIVSGSLNYIGEKEEKKRGDE